MALAPIIFRVTVLQHRYYHIMSFPQGNRTVPSKEMHGEVQQDKLPEDLAEGLTAEKQQVRRDYDTPKHVLTHSH